MDHLLFAEKTLLRLSRNVAYDWGKVYLWEKATKKALPVLSGRGLILLVCLFSMLPSGARALDYTDGEFKLDVDTTVSYSAGIRAVDRDAKLLSDINGDDGNRNFDKGDFVTNRLSAVMDIDAKFKNVGFFLRPRFFYDFAYNGSNANTSPKTNNNIITYGGPLTDTADFMDETEDAHLQKGEILDAFAYTNHSFGGHNVDFRAGRQVVSWGESLFLLGGVSSAQSALDATQAYAPGVELRDIYLPTAQASVGVDVGGGLSLAGYYQFEWRQTRLSEAGSFYSTIDYLDNAGERILVPVLLDAGLAATIDRTPDEDAKDSGQFGVAIRYLAEELNATEFGLYFLNYHEKVPMLKSAYSGGTPSPAMLALGGSWANLVPSLAVLDFVDQSSYHLAYAEDIKLFGLSAGTVIADANVGFEVSYRKDIPMAVTDLTTPLTVGYKEGDYFQMQVSIIDIFPSTILYDQLTVTAEAGMGIVSGIPDDFSTPSNGDLLADEFSWGFVTRVAFDWFNVFPAIDLNVPIIATFNPNGTSPLGTFTEDGNSIGANIGVTYNKNITTSIGYTVYTNDNSLSDRDYWSFNLKYSF